MAELPLSVVNSLLGLLTSQALSAYARINGLSQQLTKWKKNLEIIRKVMHSAEERQMRGDADVEPWLDELRELAYDMEDLLELFSVEAQSNALEADTRRRSGKLTSFFIPCCSKMDPRPLLSRHRLAKEIEEVDLRLEEVIRQKALLGLVENHVARPPANPVRLNLSTVSLPEPRFVGRKEQMENLLARLTGSDSADDPIRHFTVVSIVGMGGLGKTSLARELYNHEAVGSPAFQVKAWTCVSDVFDIVAITKSILQSVDSQIDCKDRDLNWLQNTLNHKLAGKKFLIVLDDVWSEKYAELESMLNPFHSGKSGSKILLTTRSRRVAELAGDPDPKPLDYLSTDDCLSLLAYHSIGEGSFENRPRLQDIALRLVEKCGGLPLAVKTIGGLLRFESNDQKWKDVLEHDMWKRQGENNEILPALRLSYIHLPVHLKQCFAACAIFPNDYLFERDQLINLWIGHGLLQKGTTNAYYDIGIDYIHQFEVRGLLQKSKEEESLYSMHDLINDLAKSVVGIKYYNTYESKGHSNKEKVLQAAFFTQTWKYLTATEVDVYHSMKKLRAFISLNGFSKYILNGVFVSDKVIHDFIMGMKYLRMLSLSGFRIRKLPDQMGDLKLLRFIVFSYTDIEVLPESICGLINLESLILKNCTRLKALPSNIHQLRRLINLDITGSHLIEEMPPHIGRLTNLEILPIFVVGKEIVNGLKELGLLKGLVGKLQIRNLHEINDAGDAKDVYLHEKEGIRDVSFHWADLNDEGISRKEQDPFKILDHLQAPRKTESLEILYYRGKTFPTWLDIPYLENVTTITLINCSGVELLPSLGKLPSLESLKIVGLNALSRIGEEFYGTKNPFPSLLKLEFSDMPAWEEWSSREDYLDNEKPFPRLRTLYIRTCPLLKRGLPSRLDELSELTIWGSPLLETWRDSISLPSLRRMNIIYTALQNCLVNVTSLTNLTSSGIPKLDRKFLSYCVSLEEVLILATNSLVDGDFGKEAPPKLKNLRISYCDALEKLPDDFGSLPSLTHLTVQYCNALEKLPDDLGSLPSLTHLTVGDCGKLSSFPTSGFPPTLRVLTLSSCGSLPMSQLRLPQSIKTLSLYGLGEFTCTLTKCWLSTELEELYLSNLEGLTSITDAIAVGGSCSRPLSELEIRDCKSLTTLPDTLQHLSRLSSLLVSCCAALELDFFPNLPCSLSEFEIRVCPKVRSLPRDMGKLTSLKSLTVNGCEAITGIPSGGLPPNLESLDLEDCENLSQPLEEWGLKELKSLRKLQIGGRMRCMDEVACFPSSTSGSGAWSRDLPSSLLGLKIRGMKKLERLAGGLRDHLTSLQWLTIDGCEKMRFLPEGGLPHSLERFRIIHCPLLGERCSEEGNGEYWPLLQLVPSVKII